MWSRLWGTKHGPPMVNMCSVIGPEFLSSDISFWSRGARRVFLDQKDFCHIEVSFPFLLFLLFSSHPVTMECRSVPDAVLTRGNAFRGKVGNESITPNT